MVSTVLLDLFGTLVEYQADRARLRYPVTFDLVRESGFRRGEQDFVELWDRASRQLEEETANSHKEFSMSDAAQAFCDLAGLSLSSEDASAIGRTFVREWRGHVVAVPGATTVVQALLKELAVAIVSNTHDPVMVAALLQDVGLSELIETVILSIDHGYRKPHPSIYEAALQELSSKPERTVFVGDSLVADYLAPLELGMSAYLIDPLHLHPIEQHDRLDSILDLPTRLGIASPDSPPS